MTVVVVVVVVCLLLLLLCVVLTANPNSVSLAVTNEVTPLHVAASLGHLACLQLLVQSGGDVLAMDKDQKTPLDYARAGRQDMCLNYLHEELGGAGDVGRQRWEWGRGSRGRTWVGLVDETHAGKGWG